MFFHVFARSVVLGSTCAATVRWRENVHFEKNVFSIFCLHFFKYLDI